MYKDITIEEALKISNACYIDLRSEIEYDEDTLPGAVNLPLFNSEERARIGTLFKNEGEERAKQLGLELAGPKLKDLYLEIKERSKNKVPVIFCWRGGMRSQFVAAVLSSLGVNFVRIIGGYKSYRRWVFNYLNQEELPHKAVVLHGLTGVGKTHVLEKLEKKGAPVLDLEGLACNRGSVFGNINMPPSPGQKKFESLIVDKLETFAPSKYFIVECEGKRLGNLLVPQVITKKINSGYKILLYAKLSTRVNRIIEDYTVGLNHNIKELQISTTRLAKRLGWKKVEEINLLLEEENFTEAFSYLLTFYYDPLYKYPQQPDENYNLCVECEDLDQAAEEIYQHIKKLPGYNDVRNRR
ncbi:tRNA 2-selenouridine(34) synthase MnmH [Desulfofalx alkaliphila]|uniref:tRNA 2-selenouridine(34) synthase MnmH n=1 Tax=Desulfofalx alkaliphila TaxID=105483 RepID=UPI0004E1C18C|nr:tRNA 2-selenouridine(34) synthase MnmH [Desulfofalx alkaliphila]